MSRFDYVKYDEKAVADQVAAKHWCMGLDELIVKNLMPSRATSLALTRLEEAYMWIGKAIRDDQIARNGSAPLQEERNDE